MQLKRARKVQLLAREIKKRHSAFCEEAEKGGGLVFVEP